MELGKATDKSALGYITYVTLELSFGVIDITHWTCGALKCELLMHFVLIHIILVYVWIYNLRKFA